MPDHAAQHRPSLERRPHDAEHGPVDPDVDPDLDLPDAHQPPHRREWGAHRWTLPTIAVGGMVGAAARHGLEVAWPTGSGGFPWSTFATNTVGCALIGALMVYVVDHGAGHPLLRPFAGVGVLGGFTTFSTYTVQTTDLTDAGEPVLALAYLFGTVAAALLAVTAGVVLGRSLLALRRRSRGRDLAAGPR